jgi:hypothetical protein
MLAIDGALRGLWVGFLVLAVWVVVGQITGWSWMAPLNLPIALVSALVAALLKVGKHL